MPLSRRRPLPEHLAKYAKHISDDWQDVMAPEISPAATPIQIHDAIVNFIEAYEDTDPGGIFVYYVEDFEFWTLETFERADQQVLQWFRDWLRDHRIFVTRQPGYPVTKALFDLARQDTMPAWDEIKPSTIDRQELVKARDPEPLIVKGNFLEWLEVLEVVERVEAVNPRAVYTPKEIVKAAKPLAVDTPQELVKAAKPLAVDTPQELVKARDPEPPMIKANFPEPPEATELAKAQQQEPPEAMEATELIKAREPEPLTIKGNIPEPPEVTELAKVQKQELPEAMEIRPLDYQHFQHQHFQRHQYPRIWRYEKRRKKR
ncbi:hypothetical protein MY4824_005983 [Beauveria thailandica]